MSQLLNYLVENEPAFRRARLPALYSDFQSQRSLNPDGYEANVSAWRRVLARVARSGLGPSSKAAGGAKMLSSWSNSKKQPASSAGAAAAAAAAAARPNLLVLHTGESLLRALESKRYGRPLALGAVVHEALSQRDLFPLGDFLTSQTSVYPAGGSGGRGVGAWSVWDVASWAMRQTGVADLVSSAVSGVVGRNSSSDRVPEGDYVVLANVEDAGRQFMSRRQKAEDDAAAAAKAASVGRSRWDRTFSRSHFCRALAEQLVLEEEEEEEERGDDVEDGDDDRRRVSAGARKLSDTDVEVLLRFLARDKGLLLYDGKTVRVKPLGGQDAQGEEPILTEEDASVAQLKELIAHLTHQTAVLARRVDELDRAARDAVAPKTGSGRQAALAALRSRKLAEATLAQRYATLGQLETVAARIEQAADSVAVVRAMEAGEAALRGLNARVGGVERVEQVVDRLREQVDAADEVGSILAAEAAGMGTTAAAAAAEEEIDQELEKMVAEEERQKKKKKEDEEKKRREGEEEEEEEEEEERKRKEAAVAAEAEETRRRLEAIGDTPAARSLAETTDRLPPRRGGGGLEKKSEAQQDLDTPEAMMGRLTLTEEEPRAREAA